MYKMKQTAKRTFPPNMPPNMKAPVPRGSSYSDPYSHESCPTSSCDSCFGYIYDNGHDSNTEEWDEEDDDDDGNDDDDEDQSSVSTSACQSQVTDPFSMSSMSSLFGPSSFSAQQPHGSAFGAPPPLVPLTSKGKEHAQQSRCSCQKTSKGYCNVTSGPASGVNGQNQNQNTTETQLSIFSNNGQTGTDNQTQTTDSQALGQFLSDGRSTVDIKGKNGNGNGMIKNLNVYNPNITIQVTPENFNRFSTFFPPKSGSGNGNGSKGAHTWSRED